MLILYQSPHDAVQEAQIVIDLFIAVELSYFFWYKGDLLLLAPQRRDTPLHCQRGTQHRRLCMTLGGPA